MIYIILAVPLLIGILLAFQAVGTGANAHAVDPSRFEEPEIGPPNWQALDAGERLDYLKKVKADFLLAWRVCRLMAPLMKDTHRGWPLMKMWIEFQLSYLRVRFFQLESESIITGMHDLRESVVEAVRLGFADTTLPDALARS